MSACRGIELSSEGDLASIASDRPPFTFAADPGSRRRMNVLAQSKAMLRRPMREREDGIGAIQQSEAAAPRFKSVVMPSCALSCRRSTATLVKPLRLAMDHGTRRRLTDASSGWLVVRHATSRMVRVLCSRAKRLRHDRRSWSCPLVHRDAQDRRRALSSLCSWTFTV